jgi:hypothetical protein
MASENEYVIGETEEELTVKGGPNDWDMWLCLRGTYRDVTFYTGSVPVRIPPFTDSATFFSIRVRVMGALDGVLYPRTAEEYRIEGFGNKGGHFFVATGTFNVQSRHGKFTFKKMH